VVDPHARRRGIATALLDAALAVCRQQGGDAVLLIVPRNSQAGVALARGRGATLEHSEHALVLREPPADRADDPRVILRPAVRADYDTLSALFLSGFGHPLSDPAELESTRRSRTVMVEYGGAVVGSVRLSRDGDRGGVYGFVVAAELRGRGIGREVLRRVCAELFEQGVSEVGLEVAVENDHALGLYLSLGFTRVATEDYYELRLDP
jgi:ribosomal protein S18 acetylase RimI-like enzyme